MFPRSVCFVVVVVIMAILRGGPWVEGWGARGQVDDGMTRDVSLCTVR